VVAVRRAIRARSAIAESFLISVLLIFADQIVNKFLGATDRTITVAMSAYLFFGVGHFHHPHPTGTRLYDFKLNTSVLHRVVAKFIKMPSKLSGGCNESRELSLISAPKVKSGTPMHLDA
jgi:hypothetical protein